MSEKKQSQPRSIPCPHPWCNVYFGSIAQLHAHTRRVHDPNHRCSHCAPERKSRKGGK